MKEATNTYNINVIKFVQSTDLCWGETCSRDFREESQESQGCDMVSGQLPPRKIAPGLIGPRTIASKIIDPGQFPQGQLPPKKIALDDLLPALAPRKIARQENCPKDELQSRYFFPTNQKA